MTTINVNDKDLTRKLGILASGMSDLTPLGNAIAGSFLAVVEDNFDSEGRPKWAGLNPDYAARRKGGKILFVTGRLRGSIITKVTSNEVMIGTNLGAGSPKDNYARIHQFGGMAGRGRAVKIPARPYLPMDKNGNLQPEAVDAINDDVDFYLDKLARK